jgi:hypothetical protein
MWKWDWDRQGMIESDIRPVRGPIVQGRSIMLIPWDKVGIRWSPDIAQKQSRGLIQGVFRTQCISRQQ